jgi:hypothetical protein
MQYIFCWLKSQPLLLDVASLGFYFCSPDRGAAYSIRTYSKKKFLPFVPGFSAAFSAPPEFSGGVPEK